MRKFHAITQHAFHTPGQINYNACIIDIALRILNGVVTLRSGNLNELSCNMNSSPCMDLCSRIDD